MKKSLFAAALAACVVTVAAAETAFVSIVADAFSHAPGEPISFSILTLDEAKKPIEGTVSWTLEADDGRAAETGTGTSLPTEPLVVKTTLDKPGFLRLRATSDGKTSIGGAAVSFEALQAVPEPDDFDAFWAAQKKVVLDADLSKATLTDASEAITSQSRYAGMSVRMLSFPYADEMVPATAWIVMPQGAAPKSLHAIKVSFDGYGFGGKTPPQWFDRGAINVQVNAHGYELGRDAEYYYAFEAGTKSNGQGYGLDPIQNADRMACYFRGMVLRNLAAIRFAMSLPEWSGSALEVQGGSQGGFQCVAMAALLPETTFCMPNAPWLCDLGGAAKLGRIRSDFQPAYTEALRYFDTVNFAKRITCKVHIQRAGLGDYVCPPSGVTILYNNLKKAKERSIHYIQGSEHLTPTDWYPPKNDWRQTFDL